MTPRGFVHYANSKLNRRAYAILGGSPFVRADMLMLLERRLRLSYKKKKIERITYYLEDIKDEPERILYPGLCNFRVVFWKSGILKEKRWREIFYGLRSSEEIYAVFVDESKEILPAFRKIFHKQGGLFIDCDAKPTEQNEGIEKFLRIRLDNVSDILLSDCAIDYLKSLPYDSIYNVIHIIEGLQDGSGVMKITADDLMKYRLTNVDVERFLAKKLIEKGRREVLRFILDDVKVSRFLFYIYKEITRLLNVKTMKGDRDVIKASTLGLPINIFRDYQKLAQKVDLNELYRRLTLVISMFRWADFNKSIYLFLMHW